MNNTAAVILLYRRETGSAPSNARLKLTCTDATIQTKIEKRLELNLSGNPTERSPSSPEKKFVRCVEVKVKRKMS